MEQKVQNEGKRKCEVFQQGETEEEASVSEKGRRNRGTRGLCTLNSVVTFSTYMFLMTLVLAIGPEGTKQTLSSTFLNKLPPTTKITNEIHLRECPE